MTSRFSDSLFAVVASAFLFACGAGDGSPSGDPSLLETEAPGDDDGSSDGKDQASTGGGAASKPKPPLDPLTLRPAYTEYLGRLTSTVQNPMYPGTVGTDLGITFERDGQLVFLFGDSLTTGGALQDVDLAATAPLAFPATGMPKLSWHSKLAPAGLKLNAMNVPVEGVPVGDDTYVFFVTKYDEATNTYGGAAVTKTTGLAFDSLQVLSETPPGNFANLSVVVDSGEAFIYGTSAKYRESAVHLARVPVGQLGDRTAWKMDPQPAVDVDCAGELSVRKHPTLALYLMTFGCDQPRGFSLYLSAKPEGPWIDAGRILVADESYERFIHANEAYVGYDDGLASPGNEDAWGGEYAPYLIPQWFTQDGDSFGIVFTASSWVPYQVHLMRVWLSPPDAMKPKPNKGANFAKAKIVNGDFATGNLSGWIAGGDGSTFSVFTGSDGKKRVTTYTPGKGDAAVGSLAQSFVVDAQTSTLSFVMHGGDGHILLKQGDEIVRESRGRRSSESGETQVKWNLTPFRGETVTLVIEDDVTGAWGFVGARDFLLQ